MGIIQLLIFLAVGAIAGWLAGTLTKGSGFGLPGNMVVGIVGAIVGGFFFGMLGVSTGGIIGSVVTATVGSVILLAAIRIIKKA